MYKDVDDYSINSRVSKIYDVRDLPDSFLCILNAATGKIVMMDSFNKLYDAMCYTYTGDSNKNFELSIHRKFTNYLLVEARNLNDRHAHLFQTQDQYEDVDDGI